MKERITLLNHILNSVWYYDEAEGLRILPYVLSMCMGPGAFAVQQFAEVEPRPKSQGLAEFFDPVQFGYGFYSGAVGKNLGMSERGFDVNTLERDLRLFADHPTQHTFFAHMDTPGGSGYGLRKATVVMGLVAEQTGKTVVGYTDTMCCSAGQWLAAGCNQFYMDPDAHAGSIGAYSVLLCARRALEAAGIDAEMFASGKLKGAGHPAFALTPEQREHVQGSIEAAGAEFRAQVQQLRGVSIAQDYMEGQALTASQCLDAGLCDGVVSSFDELVAMYEQ